MTPEQYLDAATGTQQRLHETSRQLDKTRADRDTMIRAANQAGISMYAIGKRLGFTTQAIKFIIDKPPPNK